MSKSKKNRSASNQFGHAFQTLFLTDFAMDSSDGVSRLGLRLETSLETHFCESRSRRFQVSPRSRRLQVSRLSILQRNGLLKFL